MAARVLTVCVVVLSACSATGSGAPSGSGTATSSASASSIAGSPECDAAREVAAVLAQANLAAADGVANLPTVVRQLHDVVPAELGADVDTVAETLDGFVAVLSRFDFDTAAAQADPQAATDLAALNTPEFSDSIARIQKWVGDSCA